MVIEKWPKGKSKPHASIIHSMFMFMSCCGQFRDLVWTFLISTINKVGMDSGNILFVFFNKGCHVDC